MLQELASKTLRGLAGSVGGVLEQLCGFDGAFGGRGLVGDGVELLCDGREAILIAERRVDVQLRLRGQRRGIPHQALRRGRHGGRRGGGSRGSRCSRRGRWDINLWGWGIWS